MIAKYVQVIIDLNSDGVDKPFDYLLPPELREKVQVGTQVVVPFRSGTVRGFVVSLKEETSVQNPKKVLKVEKSAAHLSPELIRLSYWVSRHFFSRWIKNQALPPTGGGRVKPQYKEVVFPLKEKSFLFEESKRISNKAFRQA